MTTANAFAKFFREDTTLTSGRIIPGQETPAGELMSFMKACTPEQKAEYARDAAAAFGETITEK